MQAISLPGHQHEGGFLFRGKCGADAEFCSMPGTQDSTASVAGSLGPAYCGCHKQGHGQELKGEVSPCCSGLVRSHPDTVSVLGFLVQERH